MDRPNLTRELPARIAAWWAPGAMAAYQLWQLAGAQFNDGGLGPVRFSVLVAGAWLGLAVLGTAVLVVLRPGRRVTPVEVLAMMVLAAALVSDVRFSSAGGLRDLALYLHAGERFLDGGAVYTTTAIADYPRDLTQLPFLYPPPTLPVFGALARLPFPLVAAGWVLGSLAAVIAALRLFGLAWRWALIALLWTPIEQGLFVGNVAVPGLLLFGLAMRAPSGLALGPLLKPQNGVVALWLLRERRWRSLVRGLGILAGIVVVTLPITGTGLWADWVASLFAYAESQRLHLSLYGVGLARWMPAWVVAVLAAGAIAAALRARGRIGLARLGLASVIASPSLWSHGFLMAIPAFLELRAVWLFLVGGLLCTGEFPGPQAALLIGLASFFITRFVRGAAEPATPGAADIHPLGRESQSWPV